MIKDWKWTTATIILDAVRVSRPSIRASVTVTVTISIVLCWLVRGIYGGDSGGGGGSCYEAKLCCSGRDSTCVVQKPPTNVMAEGAIEKPCYCDHACLKLADCCADFKKTCKVADCLVSVWHKWSACDANCGTGMMRRMRTILKEPANGGKRCPSLIQRRACLGTSCPPNPSSALKEIAMLLPLPAAATSTLSNQTSVRKPNTTEHYDDDDDDDGGGDGHLFDVENEVDVEGKASSQRYCVQFQVVKATKACQKEFSFSALSEGEKVCVQCDGEAMRPSLGYRCAGHGTTDRSTSWSALSAPHCHGKWVRLDASSPSPSPLRLPLPLPSSSTRHNSKTTLWSTMPAQAATCRRLCAEGPRFVFV